MYKFTTTDVQMLKSNCNEDFASLIEIMIQDEHACIGGGLGIEIQIAVDAAKAAEAAAAGVGHGGVWLGWETTEKRRQRE